jgi:PAS domain S-box-containing protein
VKVAANDEPVLGPAPILLVDDVAANLVALKAILTSPDHLLVTASSGEEALALLLLSQDIALILLDVLMPGMDGFEVASRLKQLESTKHIPIIFVTAVATDARQIQKAYATGAVDYLIKPLDRDIVRKKVAVFVDLYRERRKIEGRKPALLEAERKDYELKLAELRLAGDRRYRKLVEGIDHVIGWSADVKTFRLSFVSRRALKLLGYTPLELVAPDFWMEHVHPNDRERVLATLREAISEQTDRECVHRFLTADGRELWFRTGVCVEPAVGGGSPELHGMSVDITDSRRAEERLEVVVKELEEARQRFLDLANLELRNPSGRSR